MTEQHFVGTYNKKKADYTYDFGLDMQQRSTGNQTARLSEVSNNRSGIQSTNDAENDVHNKDQRILLHAGITQAGKVDSYIPLKDAWQIDYSLKVEGRHQDIRKNSSFISAAAPGQDQFVSRRYQNEMNGLSQSLVLSYGSLSKWILPAGLRMINTTFKNSLLYESYKTNGLVQDKDTLSGASFRSGYASATLAPNQFPLKRDEV